MGQSCSRHRDEGEDVIAASFSEFGSGSRRLRTEVLRRTATGSQVSVHYVYALLDAARTHPQVRFGNQSDSGARTGRPTELARPDNDHVQRLLTLDLRCWLPMGFRGQGKTGGGSKLSFLALNTGYAHPLSGPRSVECLLVAIAESAHFRGASRVCLSWLRRTTPP